MKNILFTFFAIGLLFTACQPEELSPLAYKKYAEDEAKGIIVSYEDDDISYEAIYKPTHLMLVDALRKERIDSVEYATTFKKYEQSQYVDLKVSLKKGTAAEKKEWLSKELAKIEKSIHLEINGIAVPTSLFHHEVSMGIRPYEVLLMIFPKLEAEASVIKLVFDSHILAQEMALILPFERLQHLPALKLQ